MYIVFCYLGYLYGIEPVSIMINLKQWEMELKIQADINKVVCQFFCK